MYDTFELVLVVIFLAITSVLAQQVFLNWKSYRIDLKHYRHRPNDIKGSTFVSCLFSKCRALTDICVEDNTDKRGVQLFLLVSSIQSSGRYIKSEWFIPYMQELIPLLEAGTYQKPYVDCSYIESLLFTARNNLQLKSRDFDMTSYLLHKEDAKNYTYGMVSPVGAEAKPRDFSKEPHPSPEDVEESVDDILAEIDESIKNKG